LTETMKAPSPHEKPRDRGRKGRMSFPQRTTRSFHATIFPL
jgi:hypothetical protein